MLGIITVNYHSEVHTNEFLKRLEGLPELKVVIVDNSGSFVLNEVSVNCVVLANDSNIGLSRAWIQAFKLLMKETDAVIFANNDAVLSRDYLEFCQRLNFRDYSLYGPIIKNNHGDIWSAGGKFQLPFYNVSHNTTDVVMGGAEMIQVDHLSGCIFCVPSGLYEVLEEMIPPNFFFRGEEWYLNLQAERLGIKRYLLNIDCVHDENGSHSRFSKKYLYFLFRAKFTFYRLGFPGVKGVCLSLVYLFFQLSYGIVRFAKKSEASYASLAINLLKAFLKLNTLTINENEFSGSIS